MITSASLALLADSTSTAFPLCGGYQTGQKELSDIHCPIHTITAYNTGLRQRQACVIGDKPSGADLHNQPPDRFIIPR